MCCLTPRLQWIIIQIFLVTITAQEYCSPDPVGLQDGDHQLTASSSSSNTTPENARYDAIQPADSGQLSCWQPDNTDVFAWIEVTFTQEYDVWGIQFQACAGTESASSNVMLNSVEYSIYPDLLIFQPFLDANDVLFRAIIDSSQFLIDNGLAEPVLFWKPFVARRLRLNIGTDSRFRFEVLGCPQNTDDWYCDGGLINSEVSEALVCPYPVTVDLGQLPPSSYVADSEISGNEAWRASFNESGGWRPVPSQGSEQCLKIVFPHRVRVEGILGKVGGREDIIGQSYYFQYSYDGTSWNGRDMIFFTDVTGCTRRTYFTVPKIALQVRVCWMSIDSTFYGRLSVEVLGCLNRECLAPIRLNQKKRNVIAASSTSSNQDDQHSGQTSAAVDVLGRLGLGWIPETSDNSQWFEVFIPYSYLIYAVLMQGCASEEKWVLSYKLGFGIPLQMYMEYIYDNDNEAPRQMEQIFEGNVDNNSFSTNVLPYAIISDILRVIPLTWQNDICLRLDIIGGQVDDCVIPIEPISVDQITASKEDINFPAENVFSDCWQPSANADHFENWLQVDLFFDYLIMAVDFYLIEKLPYGGSILAFRINYVSSTQESWRLYIDRNGNQNITRGYSVLDHPFTANKLRISIGKYCLAIYDIYGFTVNGFNQPVYCETDMSMESQIPMVYNDCPFPIGLESGEIKEHQLSASSSIDNYHSPNNGRLNHLYGWQSQDITPVEWFQVSFNQRKIITGLLMQGSDSCSLRRFILRFGYPSEGNDPVRFYDYKNHMDRIEEFTLNDGVNCTEMYLLNPYIRADYLRVVPVEWNNCIGLRMELLGCNDKEKCASTAGIMSGNVADNSFSASSAIDEAHVPSAARLITLSYSIACWKPALDDVAPWITVDMPQSSVYGIVMQGCEGDLWIEKFTISYMRSMEEELNVLDSNGLIKEFSANINSYDLAFITLDEVLEELTSLTIHPIKWSGGIGMTFELIACEYSPCSDRLGLESGEITDEQIDVVMPGIIYTGSLRLYGYVANEMGANSATGFGYYRVTFPDMHLIYGTITMRTLSSGESLFWLGYTYERESLIYQTIDGETQMFVGGETRFVEVRNVLDRPFTTNEVTFYTIDGFSLADLQFELLGCSVAEMGALCVGSDMVEYNGFCFGTVESSDEAACHEIFSPGSQQAIIRSQDEMEFIRMTNRFRRETYSEFIIGARSDMMGGLEWVDTTPVLFDNFRDTVVISDNDCVAVDGLDTQDWVLFDCDNQLSTSRATLCQIDLDECTQNNICSYGCVNTPGSYYCICEPGYYIGDDGHTCESGCSTLSDVMEVEWLHLYIPSDNSPCYHVLNSGITLESDALELCSQLNAELFNSSSHIICKSFESPSTASLTTESVTPDGTCDLYTCFKEFAISMCYSMLPNSSVVLDGGYGFIGCLHWAPFFNHNTEWTFEICVAKSKSIRVNFRQVSLRSREFPNAPNECVDTLAINDISSSRVSSLLVELCSSRQDLTFISRSSKISLSLEIGELTSDVPDSIGFEVLYTEIDCDREDCDYGCGVESVISAGNGIVSTPHFPQPVREYANCEFFIEVRRNKYIEIVFHNVGIATNGDGSCKDTLEVLEDGESLTDVRCGTYMPTVRSTTSAVVIVLVTGSGAESIGFNASYRTVDVPGCTFGTGQCRKRNCNTTSGMLASINFPYTYEPSCVMEWNIYVTPGFYVYFEILELDLQTTDNCNNDFLRFAISEAGTDYDDEVRPKVCQLTSGSAHMISRTNYLRVVFETNSRDEANGFLAFYEERKFEPDLINKNITGSCPSGWIKYNEQCYSIQTADTLVDWNTAQSSCVSIGGNLVSINTYDEMQFVHSMMTDEPDAIGQYVYIGLLRESFGRQLFRWVDGRPASYMDWYISSIYATDEFEYQQPENSKIDSCTAILMSSVARTDQWHVIACSYEVSQHFVCEQPLPGYVNEESISLAAPSAIDISPCDSTHQFNCSSGECIAAAYVCDGVIDCFDASDETCDSSACPEGYTRFFSNCLSLSLICDGINNVRSGADEVGCVFPRCSNDEYRCDSGKCINKTLVCNGVSECADSDDESDCVNCATGFFQCHDGSCLPWHAVCDGTKDCQGSNYEDEPYYSCDYMQTTNKTEYCPEGEEVCINGACVSKDSMCLYDVDQYGIQIGCRDSTQLRSCEDFVCPDYMFKCPNSYCIPMRKRCDGTWDCPNGEDEKDCSVYTCPGFYHCRSSRQCLSPLEVCDGVRNCPSGDDEQFCDMPCPSGCVCTGFIVQCSSVLTTNDLELLPSSVRYLDLSGSLPVDTDANRKKRTIVDDFLYILNRFPFLHTLDLSQNNIGSLNPGEFSSLSNLVKLNLSGNSIVHLEDKTFEGLHKLSTLDLSNNGLTQIDSNVFADVNNTAQLYIQGNSIMDIDGNLFVYLTMLETLVSDDYKFCCLATVAESCTPLPDEFSSCEDLMRVEVLRVFIWILGISASIGNLCVVIWRSRKKEKNKVQGYLIQNLAVSDFFMGVYLLVIASADIYYRDNYVIYANEWRNSTICSFAGFLSVFSSEMSVFILTVITIDRYICIVFPFSGFRMRPRSTLYVLVAGWLFVFLISIIPLFGSDYFANFYGVNAVCLALPITHQEVPASEYSVIVFLGLNLISFLVIAFCYLSMYISVKRSANKLKDNVLKNDNKRKELKMATKMAIIVLTDMCCWLPIITMGILARGGAVEIPGAVYAWTAVFVLPLNSAINPHLYTFSSHISFKKEKKAVTSKNTGSTPLSTPQPMKKLNNISMWVVPENIHRKRQLLPYLRESSSQAIVIATKFKDSDGGGVKDEELKAIEKKYLDAIAIIRKCQTGQSKLADIKAEETEFKSLNGGNKNDSNISDEENNSHGDETSRDEADVMIELNEQENANTEF